MKTDRDARLVNQIILSEWMYNLFEVTKQKKTRDKKTKMLCISLIKASVQNVKNCTFKNLDSFDFCYKFHIFDTRGGG